VIARWIDWVVREIASSFSRDTSYSCLRESGVAENSARCLAGYFRRRSHYSYPWMGEPPSIIEDQVTYPLSLPCLRSTCQSLRRRRCR